MDEHDTSTDPVMPTGQGQAIAPEQSDLDHWMERFEAFCDHLVLDRALKPGTLNDYRSVVPRWIRWAVDNGFDPGEHDRDAVVGFVDEFLSLSEDSRKSYRSHLRRWSAWVGSELSAGRSPRCWVVRGGRGSGDAETIGYNLAHGVTSIGWGAADWEFEFIAECRSREDFRYQTGQRFPGWSEGSRNATADQIWAFAREIEQGDVVVLPKPDARLAVGFVDGGYRTDAAAPGACQQQRDVIWLAVDVPKESVDDDILTSLKASRTVFRAGAPDAAARLLRSLHRGGAESPRGSLRALIDQFRASGSYRREDDHEHFAARERMEEILRSLPSLPYERRGEVDLVWQRKRGGDYGGPGNIVQLRSSLRDSSPQEWERLRHLLSDLCWGTDDLGQRLDRAMNEVHGLGPTSANRLVSICRPQRVIPIGTLRTGVGGRGAWGGKLDAVELLMRFGLLDAEQEERAKAMLAEHEAEGDSGHLIEASNDLLFELLEPHFAIEEGFDTWGMSRFLYWAMQRHADSDGPRPIPSHPASPQQVSRLAAAAEDLLCDVEFLDEIVDLLRDKGQVILYGPPGTGKTYFAQRLARALTEEAASEAERAADGQATDDDADPVGALSLVQFHPAYSYEDFFEGFRPRVDVDGQMAYELTPGPLVRIAERAERHPGQRHVMVIDEINRANLPRVLGELLYLLEYRDQAMQTQYRPGQQFTLPRNLWFIGTMNTADRSIALIDAAMRRRFHFVPFFPRNEGARERGYTQDLLRRWTEREAPEQEWVADLVDKVNAELTDAMGGDHLLIGPSHFMTGGLDEPSLRRIWKYNIEPLIEDQLFGRQEAIHRFRFERVWRDFGPKNDDDADLGDGEATSAAAGDETVLAEPDHHTAAGA